MTGFGRGTASCGGKEIVVQVTGGNRRNMDLSVSLPGVWQSLEADVVAAVRAAPIARGRVAVGVEVSRRGGVDSSYDADAVREELDRLRRLAEEVGVPYKPDLDLLWTLVSSPRAGGGLPEPEDARDPLASALASALEAFVEMRAVEGAALRRDLECRLDSLAAAVVRIKERAAEVPGAQRQALLQRLSAAGLSIDPADERVLKEIALFADRSDISEELTRLESHLEQLRDLFEADGEVGRKADFLLQEVGREIHTVGSKGADLEIGRAVIEFKNEAEKIREQLQNVE